MSVDLLIGIEQPDPAFTVEISNRSPQAVNGLGELLGFLRALRADCLKLGKLLLGYEIDWTYAFAFRRQPLERCSLRPEIRMFLPVEAELFGKALGQAVEPVDAVARELGAPSLLGLRSRRCCSATFAGVGRSLTGRRHLLSGGNDGLLGASLRGSRFTDADLTLVAEALELEDGHVEFGGFLFKLGALRIELLSACGGGCKPLLGIGLTLAPITLLASCNIRSFPVSSRFSRDGCRLRALVGDP